MVDNRIRKNQSNIDDSDSDTIIPDDTQDTQEDQELEEIIEDSDEPSEDIKDDIIEEEVENEEDTEEEPEEEPQPTQKQQGIDEQIEENDDERERLRKQLKSSQAESLNNYFQNKRFVETVDELDNLPEPTEAELEDYTRKEFDSDYTEYDSLTQRLIKKQFISDRSLSAIKQVARESRAVREWSAKVDSFLEDPAVLKKFPNLEDSREAFKNYCMKNTRRGNDLNDLVASFAFSEMPVVRPKKTGKSLFATQGNGNFRDTKKAGMSANEVASLRKTNPKLYRQKIKSGQIGKDFKED